MERASRVMYSIANIFNWIDLILTAGLIVLAVLNLCNVPNVPVVNQPIPTIVLAAIAFLVCLILISMVRIAKAKNSSKGWDVLFIVLGVIAWNPFYVLGGIFGVIARR